ncbi:hypothetical protein FHX15_005422 [Rhizobium sp. BK650]|uniref:hypothetical protein n=1 Tax=Rhizobium sp. BK650 TaxID=2586990 RepID=UPI00182F9264|nr:hypothetical protein [Rhizobium sp. BK650]MBB3660153.1 hypothetical protein [Rhizobium sp. BK650]
MTNLSRPDEAHWIALSMHMVATQPPPVVEHLMLGVLRSWERILKISPPSVALKTCTGI